MISGEADINPTARLRAGHHTLVIREPGGRTTSAAARPEWTILLPFAGDVEWRTSQHEGGRAAGVIFPPRSEFLASSDAGHISIFVDAWFQALGPGRRAAIPLDHVAVEHLRPRWSGADDADLDAIAADTVSDLRRRRVLAPAVPVDPRIATVVRDLAVADSIGDLAAHVGLSQSRLRTLVHELTGVPPTRLRMWQRLRAAILDRPDKPLALAAAQAGFADQAHMTRTAVRLVGWTPGELTRE